jgi:hypothetical protein
VERLKDDRIKALSRTFATVRWSPDGVEAVGEQLSELCATLAHNLREPAQPRLVRRIVNSQLKPEFVRVVRPHLEEQASAFVDTMERVLNDPMYTAGSAQGVPDAKRMGLAVYMFEDEAEGTVGSLKAPSHKATSARVRKTRKRRQTQR